MRVVSSIGISTQMRAHWTSSCVYEAACRGVEAVTDKTMGDLKMLARLARGGLGEGGIPRRVSRLIA